MGDFRNQIGNLSAGEKLEPLDVVSESLEGDAPLTDAQRTELDYRMARYEQNPTGVIRWEQVRPGLFRKQ
jgi:putative addiction module component (TIGR02574 family)